MSQCLSGKNKSCLLLSRLSSNLLLLTTYYLPLKNKKTMKKETWKTILQIIASIISAALTALGTTSCMGYGPMAH